MNVEAMRAFAREVRKKRDLEAQLRDCNERVNALSDVALKELDAEGIRSFNIEIDGEAMSIQRHSILWPEIKVGHSKEDLLAALRGDVSTAWMVQENVNTNTLGAWMRERMDDGGLPAAVAAVLEPRERRSTRAVAAQGGKKSPAGE